MMMIMIGNPPWLTIYYWLPRCRDPRYWRFSILVFGFFCRRRKKQPPEEKQVSTHSPTEEPC